MKANNEESAKAQAAYMRYLGMGPERSLPKLARIITFERYGEVTSKVRSIQRVLEGWSSRYKWVQRAKEHDSEVLHRELQHVERQRRADIEEMNERHIKLGRAYRF